MSGYPQEIEIERERFEAVSRASMVQEALKEIERIKVARPQKFYTQQFNRVNAFIENNFGGRTLFKDRFYQFQRLENITKNLNIEVELAKVNLDSDVNDFFDEIFKAQERYNQAFGAASADAISFRFHQKSPVEKRLVETKKEIAARESPSSRDSFSSMSISSASPPPVSDAAPRPTEHWLVQLLEAQTPVLAPRDLEIIKRCNPPNSQLVGLITQLLKKMGDRSIDLGWVQIELDSSSEMAPAFNQWVSNSGAVLMIIQAVLPGTILGSCIGSNNFSETILSKIKNGRSSVSAMPALNSSRSVASPASLVGESSIATLASTKPLELKEGSKERQIKALEIFTKELVSSVPARSVDDSHHPEPEPELNIGHKKVISLLMQSFNVGYSADLDTLNRHRDPLLNKLFRCCAQTNSMKCSQALSSLFKLKAQGKSKRKIESAKKEAVNLFRKVLGRSGGIDKEKESKLFETFQSALEKI